MQNVDSAYVTFVIAPSVPCDLLNKQFMSSKSKPVEFFDYNFCFNYPIGS